MAIRMMGPLTGADARAYRHPPAAARPVQRAARKRIKAKRTVRFGRRDDTGGYFASCSSAALACVASGEVGSTATTCVQLLTAVSVSPLFMAIVPSLNSGFPHDKSASA